LLLRVCYFDEQRKFYVVVHYDGMGIDTQHVQMAYRSAAAKDAAAAAAAAGPSRLHVTLAPA
jgi:hypothetical protein